MENYDIYSIFNLQYSGVSLLKLIEQKLRLERYFFVVFGSVSRSESKHMTSCWNFPRTRENSRRSGVKVQLFACGTRCGEEDSEIWILEPDLVKSVSETPLDSSHCRQQTTKKMKTWVGATCIHGQVVKASKTSRGLGEYYGPMNEQYSQSQNGEFGTLKIISRFTDAYTENIEAELSFWENGQHMQLGPHQLHRQEIYKNLSTSMTYGMTTASNISE
ncbi:hypothetical protein NE237_008649 [Protea cynaroides]|uniref:Uncharacterized protein n=1 Tax=Protea cynaroides TaxID=273540 RepID=A0A9Q0KWF8_9MAGN|nr:hypothetical protein NE237_008649 [Protea cynaroides]